MLFRIYKVLSNGNLHFIEAVQDFDTAKARMRELRELCPGDYVIHNEDTGERMLIPSRDAMQ
jgi:hypothetical protein